MSTKYPGGIISKTAPTPSGPYADSTAPGIWTLEQQAYWQKLGQWPTQGNVNPSAFIENLFSTYLYTGTGAAQTITNGVNLSANGGMVWFKARSAAYTNRLFDTARGVGATISSNSTGAQFTDTTMLSAFNTTGFSLGLDSSGGVNDSGATFASWTFRKQAKFFDVVTFTATRSGSGWSGGPLVIPHSLQSKPGFIVWKATSTSSGWEAWHTATGDNQYLTLNSTSAAVNVGSAYCTPTSTNFTLQDIACGIIGDGVTATFVAYLFAHDAGGFGLTGTDNVISCGSFVPSGDTTVTLGYEPQWILIKRTDASDSWKIWDNMRGWAHTTYAELYPNSSAAEAAGNGNYTFPTATGFVSKAGWLTNGATYVYIAIRRGPMKVPTDGTSVFSAQTGTYSAGDSLSVGFPADMYIDAWRTGTLYKANYSRLVNFANSNSSASQNYLKTNTTDAEVTTSQAPSLYDLWNTTAKVGSWNAGVSEVWWMFRRAPSFFDEVCYTGTDAVRTINHNLGVAPELIIVKGRNTNPANSSYWTVYAQPTGNTNYMYLDSTNATSAFSGYWNNTSPTASVFTLGTGNGEDTNATGKNYVAYLFATCAGVSKVGSYTGTGTTKQIDCGFTGGARFVLIKRTDSTGDWYVWDSARGIVAGNDPYLLLNSTAAEVTGTDYVDTYSAGFEISSTAPSAINASGGTFIFLAIA